MGFSLNPLTGFGLLENDTSGATAAAQFNPYNIQSSYGSLNYDPTNRLFTSAIDPQIQGSVDRLWSQYGQISPEQQLSLFRQQAAPFNEAQSLGLENRLFSQGRLDHSQVDQPGGARRSLFDSFANQDFGFQQQATAQSQQAQTNFINQILGLMAPEQNLFNAGMGLGQIGAQGQIAGANIQGQAGLQQQQLGYNIFNDILGGVSSLFGGQ